MSNYIVFFQSQILRVSIFMAYAVSQISWIIIGSSVCHLGNSMIFQICNYLWLSSILIWIIGAFTMLLSIQYILLLQGICKIFLPYDLWPKMAASHDLWECIRLERVYFTSFHLHISSRYVYSLLHLCCGKLQCHLCTNYSSAVLQQGSINFNLGCSTLRFSWGR